MGVMTRPTRTTPVLTALVALGLVLGLTGCEVKDETQVAGPGYVNLVKECAPTRVQITAQNIGRARYDIEIRTNGVTRATRANVAPGSGLLWTGTENAITAQVGFSHTGGGRRGDRTFVEVFPAC